MPEAPLPAEKNLHDVLTSHPELLPADDLEVGQTIVVGRESGLESGYVDLVLVDAYGQICLVEVKNEGNPDTRRVIAQLLDYAAALWQMSVDDFERTVLHPYLRSIDQHDASLKNIANYVADNLQDTPGDVDGGEDDDDPSTLTDFPANLEQTLASGHFRLIVASPSIPSGVEKVIEYLNAQGHLIYGLEVSFFGGVAECFVPNLVVKPRVSETKRIAARKPAPIDETKLGERLPARVKPLVEDFLNNVGRAGGQVRWTSSGASIRPARADARVISTLESGRIAITVLVPNGYPDDPFLTAHKAAESLGVGVLGNDGWQYSIKWDESTDEQINGAFDIAITLLERLVPQIDFQPLEPPLTVAFERNDHMIWAKSVPPLDSYVGRWLRGTITRLETSAAAEVDLQPMAGEAPGWRPQLTPTSARETVWPTGDLSGEMTLEIKLVESTAATTPS
ncbi:MAG: hypothetical protein WB709_08680 [Solirubrobacteraceae bacterium]